MNVTDTPLPSINIVEITVVLFAIFAGIMLIIAFIALAMSHIRKRRSDQQVKRSRLEDDKDRERRRKEDLKRLRASSDTVMTTHARDRATTPAQPAVTSMDAVMVGASASSFDSSSSCSGSSGSDGGFSGGCDG